MPNIPPGIFFPPPPAAAPAPPTPPAGGCRAPPGTPVQVWTGPNSVGGIIWAACPVGCQPSDRILQQQGGVPGATWQMYPNAIFANVQQAENELIGPDINQQQADSYGGCPTEGGVIPGGPPATSPPNGTFPVATPGGCDNPTYVVICKPIESAPAKDDCNDWNDFAWLNNDCSKDDRDSFHDFAGDIIDALESPDTFDAMVDTLLSAIPDDPTAGLPG